MRTLLLSLAVIATSLLAGCQSTPTADPSRVIEGTAIATDGVEIAYDIRGRGGTALVFIHGWCSNRGFWREQLEVFADAYRMVAIDLPGHGAAGRDREAWSFSAFASDVESVVESLDLKRVVLVGHSMGGPVALEAAARMPGRVIGVVPVDTLQNAETEAPPQMLEQIAVAFETDWEGTMNAFLPQFFLKDADPELVRWVIEESIKADPVMAAAIMRDQCNIDKKALLSSAGVPVRCINAAAGTPGPPVTQIDINRKHADFDAVFVDGVGHFPHMERPQAFNEKLRAVLAVLEKQ